MSEVSDRDDLGLELVRVTEAAALAAARWQGRGDKEAVDQAAVDGMRLVFSTVDIAGTVVVGEGKKTRPPCSTMGSRLAPAEA